MSEKIDNILNSIKTNLAKKTLSISDIAKTLKINWRTAENHLEKLKNLDIVGEIENKKSRIFFYKDKNNYFEIPIREEDRKKISTIYFEIKKTCLKIFKKEPTKTQVYKIMWKINKKLKLNLPIGWYQYGPCCVQVYEGNETKETDLNKETIVLIKETTKEYCDLDNSTLQKRVYVESKNNLYLTKQKLMEEESSSKTELNLLLMDLIRYTPDETINVITDFSRASLLIGWKKTKSDFMQFVWKYITLVNFKNSLKVYNENIELYFNKKIDTAKKEAQIAIMDLVRNRVK